MLYHVEHYFACHLVTLRSAVGERKQWSAGGETAGTEPERNAAAEPQTEARTFCAFK